MRCLNRLVVRVLVLGCVIGLTLAGCGGGDDDDDSISGNFRGTIQDSVSGTGTITATLAQNGNTVSGTFQTSFPSGNGGGSVSGTRSGDGLTLTVTPPQPTACPSNVTAAINGDEIRGTYAAFNCTVVDTGSFTLTLQ